MTLREYTNWVNRCIVDGYLTFRQGFNLLADKASDNGIDEFPHIEAVLKPVAPKRRVRRTRAQIAVDAAKAAGHIPAQPAKRLGRKPGSKNRPKVVVSPINGTQASA